MRCVAPAGAAFLQAFGLKGASPEQFEFQRFLALDHAGNVVIADAINHRLQVLRIGDGAFLRTIGSYGVGAGQFNQPYGVALDGNWLH